MDNSLKHKIMMLYTYIAHITTASHRARFNVRTFHQKVNWQKKMEDIERYMYECLSVHTVVECTRW